LYILEEICLNKIEGIVGYFKEKIEVIHAIANYHSSNKKLVEVANSIVSLLTDKPIPRKQVIVEDQPKSTFKLNSVITNSNPSNVSSNQGVETQKDSKFSFIKKKTEGEVVTGESSKQNSTRDVFNLIPSKSEEIVVNQTTTEKPKFSFIKASTNNNKQNGEIAQTDWTINNNPVYDLTSKLQEVFGSVDLSYSEPVKNGHHQEHNHINHVNTTPHGYMNGVNTTPQGYINGVNTTPHGYTNGVSSKSKYDAPDFDIIFHTSNLNKDPSPVRQEPIEQPKPKVDHFDFVNDLLKKK
jgi:hypothetical protein